MKMVSIFKDVAVNTLTVFALTGTAIAMISTLPSERSFVRFFIEQATASADGRSADGRTNGSSRGFRAWLGSLVTDAAAQLTESFVLSVTRFRNFFICRIAIVTIHPERRVYLGCVGRWGHLITLRSGTALEGE